MIAGVQSAMDRLEATAGGAAGMVVAGKAGEEISRTSESISIMEFDVLFGVIAPYELPLSGLIMIIGLGLALGTFIFRNKR